MDSLIQILSFWLKVSASKGQTPQEKPMNSIKRITLLICLLLMGWSNVRAQKQQDSTERIIKPYSKLKFEVGYTAVLGFNLGEKYMTYPAVDRMWGNYYGSSHYINPKEKAQLGYQFSLEFVTKSFFKDKLAIRIGVGINEFYYTGTATTVHSSIINQGSPFPLYKIDTIIDGRQYYFKDYFLNFSLVPQFNINKSDNLVFYYFLGASLDGFFDEVHDLPVDEWLYSKKRTHVFGITGLGSTIKITNKSFLDTQLRFTCQLSQTPRHRRLAAAGIRIGFMF